MARIEEVDEAGEREETPGLSDATTEAEGEGGEAPRTKGKSKLKKRVRWAVPEEK